ncbi:hypothetical protein DVA67_021715 [Solirubrobacter sp. CPCC 204708]|uniref:DUF1835 domain-containing protein n=1 Tax=Solirubrobacter deserti TaxID=2282478 RepID=A0ABT4REV6_9ACTN|nr:hypothetical protein [Solirubrobacter deserti]MBE2318611.1 hypothetical protein [Solirubrobacter deserti]MDA0137069.1 hypothetical protein [Solirubrobacter deserti]
MALHVTNGDSTVPELRATGLAPHILPWRDALHEGPVPEQDLRRARAHFLGIEEEELAGRDRTLDELDEFVLWFEADLYDQLQLIEILARLHARRVPADRIALVCIGEFPGIAHFGGLGELTAAQLSTLPRLPLTDAALEHATRAWAAFRAPEPTGLAAIATHHHPELRFLAEAFDRLGREYPSTRDGLSLSERRLLAAVAAGARTRGDAFLRAAAREPRPFMGDTWAFDRLDRLAAGPHPLLDGLELTDLGRDVLEGRADHVALNGIDRWIGGVHLTADRWRFDEGTETVTRRA